MQKRMHEEYTAAIPVLIDELNSLDPDWIKKLIDEEVNTFKIDILKKDGLLKVYKSGFES
jgi:hypothetical protein